MASGTVMRLREPYPAMRCQPETGRCIQEVSIINPSWLHLAGYGWLTTSVTGSRKRITGNHEVARPLRHASRRSCRTAPAAPALPSVHCRTSVHSCRTLPYTAVPPYTPAVHCRTCRTLRVLTRGGPVLYLPYTPCTDPWCTDMLPSVHSVY